MTDLRRPAGYLFALLGILLLAYGFLNPGERARLDPGVNVNVWCGLAIAVFGASLLWLAQRNKS